MTERRVVDDEIYEDEGRRFRVPLRRPHMTMEAGIGALLAVVGSTALIVLVELLLRKGG